MTMTLTKQAELITDINHRTKVIQAVYQAAAAIGSEADSTPNHEARIGLIRAVLRNESGIKDSFICGVTAILDSESYSDNDLSTAVASLWTTYAISYDFPKITVQGGS